MWRPEFDFVAAHKARLYGYHRRLCVYSHHYRGTPEVPGLVLGLDRGGSCLGIVYDVEAGHWERVLAQVRKRELLGDAYDEAVKSFELHDSGRKVEAITYVVQRGSVQYAPLAPKQETLRLINQGQGAMGTCREYVANTIRHLRQLGIHDAGLENLAGDVLGEIRPRA